MSFAYITEEGAYIQKRGGCFTVGRNRECVMEIPAETLEGLTLIDAVQVSSKAIVELLRLGIRRRTHGDHGDRGTTQTTSPSARGALATATSRTSSYFRETLIKQSLRLA